MVEYWIADNEKEKLEGLLQFLLDGNAFEDWKEDAVAEPLGKRPPCPKSLFVEDSDTQRNEVHVVYLQMICATVHVATDLFKWFVKLFLCRRVQ